MAKIFSYRNWYLVFEDLALLVPHPILMSGSPGMLVSPL